jgi:hypothetical protein
LWRRKKLGLLPSTMRGVESLARWGPGPGGCQGHSAERMVAEATPAIDEPPARIAIPGVDMRPAAPQQFDQDRPVMEVPVLRMGYDRWPMVIPRIAIWSRLTHKPPEVEGQL